MADMYAAQRAVQRAVKAGQLPRVCELACADCKSPAQVYHHGNGYDDEHVFDVEPLCRACHRRRHSAAVSASDERIVRAQANLARFRLRVDLPA